MNQNPQKPPTKKLATKPGNARRVHTDLESPRHHHYRSRRPVRREVSAGGVVARRERDNWLVALLKTEHKRGEVWILPKGHVELDAGETAAAAAKREVQEEAGITSLSVKDQLGVTKYSFQAEEALVKKTVHYFLMITDQKKLTPQAEEYLSDAIWLPIDQAISRLAYDTDRRIVTKAKAKLTGQPISRAHTFRANQPSRRRPSSPKNTSRPPRKPNNAGGPLRIHT